MFNNNIYKMINVIAKTISKDSITYVCPVCMTKYKKNGKPYATAKYVEHIHGNETESLENRQTSRSHHVVWNFPKNQENYSNVCIIIDDSTLRV